MNATALAARFTAFAYFLNANEERPPTAEEAGRLARENWPTFVGYASPDLAAFLTDEPKPRASWRPLPANHSPTLSFAAALS